MTVENMNKNSGFARRMSIREFADKIGVSTTTVSASLNRNGRVSEATHEMVRRAAAEFGYVPNANARRLAKQKSYLVSFIHPIQEVFADMHQIQLIYAFMDSLRGVGYDMVLDPVAKDQRWEPILQERIRSGAVDATVVQAGVKPPDDLLHDLSGAGHVCVLMCVEPIEGFPNIGSVVEDMRPTARKLAQLFVKNGHRRIGYIGDDPPNDPVSESFMGELKTLDVSAADDCVVEVETTADAGAESLKRLMSLPDPPTAIFARNDVLALGALRAAAEMGLRVPKDVSIVGHDDLPIVQVVQPSLTTIRIDYNAIGKAVASLLIQLFKRPSAPLKPVYVGTVLIERDTLGPAPRA